MYWSVISILLPHRFLLLILQGLHQLLTLTLIDDALDALYHASAEVVG